MAEDAQDRPRAHIAALAVLSVATLLVLSYGTRAEDAAERAIAPGRLRAPPKRLRTVHRGAESAPNRPMNRLVSVLRLGIIHLRRLLHRGRLWRRVWLIPQDWPEPSPNLNVVYHTYT